ncbi:salivary glue protein Sgs-5 [Drosophila pseudoobscura]|uniref:Salivary glue protein Sgs-5 n=1 Tax=Drosophila pseudoobscura pseudoobscura TaxID=46245 RepID=A0A6I8UMQ6_DROPS|nr:salivary glue protein Sgs-5 [Drosophila pseudoobscura]
MLKSIFLVAALLVVVQATILLPKPQPVEPCSTCNLYQRDYTWALEDCTCRVFQNACLLGEENARRKKAGKTPLIIISEKVCRSFIPKKCLIGLPVVAKFPKPAPCGCNGKPGNLVNQQFKNHCALKKYSSENSKPYISYTIGIC